MEKGTQTPGKDMVGTVTLKQIYHIAQVRPTLPTTAATTTSPAAWSKQRRGQTLDATAGRPQLKTGRGAVGSDQAGGPESEAMFAGKHLQAAHGLRAIHWPPGAAQWQRPALLRDGPNRGCLCFVCGRSCGTKGGKRPTRRLRNLLQVEQATRPCSASENKCPNKPRRRQQPRGQPR